MGFAAEHEVKGQPTDSGWKRIYFEQGCACINKYRTMQACPAEMSDDEAVEYYEENCDCSRNYT